jgi:hypothetical protein
MFGEMKPLLDTMDGIVRNHIDQQIEDAASEIVFQKRKIKRLKSQLVYLMAFTKELAKPPKPFKPPKLTKAQRKAYDRTMAAMRAGPGVVVPPNVAMRVRNVGTVSAVG